MASPFERMKVAWISPDPSGELNRVVEVMAAEGMVRDEIDSALAKLLDEVRSGGADDDTEEIINCVGDRLHGWCHASHRIATSAGLDKSSNGEEIAERPTRRLD